MRDSTATDREGRATALARQDEILALYQSLKRSLIKQILHWSQDPEGSAKGLVAKLGDLSATHLILLKAEDAFRDKFCEEDESVPDYDALRAEIGRRLDRIRYTREAEGVSGQPDRP